MGEHFEAGPPFACGLCTKVRSVSIGLGEEAPVPVAFTMRAMLAAVKDIARQ
jgi:hypothetical protein